MKTPIRLDTLFRIVCCLICLAVAPPGLSQTGAVLGFGYNRTGQIGDNTTSTRSRPTPAFYISGATAVSCGTNHTLALDSSGTVWAWGDNSSGQLGTGDTTNRTTPVAVLTGIKAIAAGGAHSLALQMDGTVLAWGFNRYGQLGQGDTYDRYLPVPMVNGDNARIKAIAAGGVHSVVLADTSYVYTCGANYAGQLGLGDTLNRAWLYRSMNGVKAIAAGSDHTLTLGCDSWVCAAGFNAQGQLGDGTTQSKNAFIAVTGGVRAISAGFSHSLALCQDGKVKAWGDNNFGALGTGDQTRRLYPTLMTGASNIKAIAAGGRHSVLLTGGGNVLAVGDNSLGQLGTGSIGGIRKGLAQVGSTTMIGAIAAGGFHTMVLRPFTVAMSTGLNNYGQLGIGSGDAYKSVPAPVTNVQNIIAVAAGPNYGMHSLFLRADGTVWACGWNSNGQLGDGTYDSRTAPVQVKGPGGSGFLKNIVAVAAGDSHSMALAADGTIYTWGSNGYGQLGVGSGIVSAVYPVKPNISKIIAIAAGGMHSLLLGSGGEVMSAGWGQYGQLGVGDTVNRYEFRQPSGLYSQIAIAAGGMHSMSLNYSGEISAWGANAAGQLGLGDTSNRIVPKKNNGTLATSISCGGRHSLCTTGYGQVWGTGGNELGQLGLGGTAPRHEWEYNATVPNSVGVAAGQTHSLFLSYTGTLTASGLGAQGQLGTGTVYNSAYPTLVSSPFGNIAMVGGACHSLVLAAPPILVTSVTVSPTSVKGGTGATGTVTLNGLAGPGGQRVYLYCFSQDQYGNYVNAASMPSYVDVPASSSKATFAIKTTPVSSQVTTTVAAYLNQVLATTLTVNP